MEIWYGVTGSEQVSKACREGVLHWGQLEPKCGEQVFMVDRVLEPEWGEMCSCVGGQVQPGVACQSMSMLVASCMRMA